MYQVAYHKLSDPINEEDLNSTDTFLDLVGLEMNTDYIFKIKAYTSRGAGPWSNKLHFRTFGRSKCMSWLFLLMSFGPVLAVHVTVKLMVIGTLVWCRGSCEAEMLQSSNTNGTKPDGGSLVFVSTGIITLRFIKQRQTTEHIHDDWPIYCSSD